LLLYFLLLIFLTCLQQCHLSCHHYRRSEWCLGHADLTDSSRKYYRDGRTRCWVRLDPIHSSRCRFHHYPGRRPWHRFRR
jgi:hypothetical protein